ncbi:MAG: hypothetical protein J7K21_06370, partial [Desulfurococcales archaeon]|nr:hypothetical protein [Desulfurococcales archaeon]
MIINLEEHYDLCLTLLPSFIYPLFEMFNKFSYKKIIGYCQDSILTQKGDIIELSGCNNPKVLYEWGGLWFDPVNYVSDVDHRYLIFVEKLIDKYHGVRMAISPIDAPWVFISVFLSRATDFYRNTVRWVRKIARKNPLDPFNIDPDIIGKNFQLQQLKMIMND